MEAKIAEFKYWPGPLKLWTGAEWHRLPAGQEIVAGLEVIPWAHAEVGAYRRAVAAGLVTNGNAFKGYRLTEAGAALLRASFTM